MLNTGFFVSRLNSRQIIPANRITVLLDLLVLSGRFTFILKLTWSRRLFYDVPSADMT
jgi:hypothetical protein